MVNVENRNFNRFERFLLYFCRTRTVILLDEDKDKKTWSKLYYKELFGKVFVVAVEAYKPEVRAHLSIIK